MYNAKMRKFFTLLLLITLLNQPVFAWSWNNWNSDEKAITTVFKKQVKYANKNDLDKFIKTYDTKFVNGDGFNLDVYSSLIQDVWKTYDNIEYDIDIKDIKVENNKATVKLVEKSYAELVANKAYEGELQSEANTICYLEKINGVWKITSDKVVDETTSILYGTAKGLDIKLTVPQVIEANKDYTVALEFTPPKETVAIASITSEIVEYPQKTSKEVFRALPEDNILERIFTSNSDNANEYIVASIGLTKTSICDLNLQLSLTGFGYTIKRVNVIANNKEEKNEQKQ